MGPLTLLTAPDTPLPPKRPASPSRSSRASCSPVEAPLGSAARPNPPSSSHTSASSVGLPRESRICRAWTDSIEDMGSEWYRSFSRARGFPMLAGSGRRRRVRPFREGPAPADLVESESAVQASGPVVEVGEQEDEIRAAGSRLTDRLEDDVSGHPETPELLQRHDALDLRHAGAAVQIAGAHDAPADALDEEPASDAVDQHAPILGEGLR